MSTIHSSSSKPHSPFWEVLAFSIFENFSYTSSSSWIFFFWEAFFKLSFSRSSYLQMHHANPWNICLSLSFLFVLQRSLLYYHSKWLPFLSSFLSLFHFYREDNHTWCALVSCTCSTLSPSFPHFSPCHYLMKLLSFRSLFYKWIFFLWIFHPSWTF